MQQTIVGVLNAYSKQLIDHYENPRNVGSLDKTKKNVALV